MIKSFSEYHQINEGKQVGLIYHVMGRQKFIDILKYDILSSKWNISFTRNSMYDRPIGMEAEGGEYAFQIEVDGDKLSNNHKISPTNDGKGWVADEFEERVEGKVHNIGKYIKRIIVILHRAWWENLKKYNKRDYQKFLSYGDKWGKNISRELFEYTRKYPHIEIVVKDNHNDLLFNVHNDEQFLKGVGLKNPLEENLYETILGVWKDKKRLLKSFLLDSSTLYNYIKSNKKKLFIEWQEYEDYEDGAQGVGTGEILNLEQYEKRGKESGDPYFESYLAEDPSILLTNDLNKHILIDLIYDKNDRIIIRISHGNKTEKELSFYKSLIKKHTSKEIQTVNVEKRWDEYYNDMRVSQEEYESEGVY